MRFTRTTFVAAAVASLVIGGSAAAAYATNPARVSQKDLAASKFDPTAVSKVTPLARDCGKSVLPLHNGFQQSPACVTTADGEVSAFNNNPTLAFIDPPSKIREGHDFTLKVSTRNLVRDRFLGAADGGYYLESSLLVTDGPNAGLTRGHFHLGCQVLSHNGRDVNSAPVPSRSVFFKAVEDGKGGVKPDTVAITVTGKDALTGKTLFQKGDTVQCAAWAGDGSHRTPMMTFANEIPAFDSVRLDVKGHDW